MTARTAEVARAAGGGAVLLTVVWAVGPEPFAEAARSLDPVTVAVALLLTGVSTLACAWRWSRVSRGLAVEVRLAAAARACYRAQLLNLVLPGGVLGDVHRGLRHGRDTGETSLALRSVAWERTAGQVVQGVALLLVLAAAAGPSVPPAWYAAVAGGAVAVALVVRSRRTRALVRRSRLLRAAADDVRRGLLGPGLWPVVVTSSLVALAAHVTTFLLAARSVGVSAPLGQLLPVTLLVLGAAALPASLAGWGPREGAAVAAFATTGLGAQAGAAAAAAYGLLVLAAHLPALVLLVRRPRAVTPAAATPIRSLEEATP